jgi:hypothetical protein
MMFSGRSRNASSTIAWNVNPISFDGEAHANEVSEPCHDIAALIWVPIPPPPGLSADLRWLHM